MCRHKLAIYLFGLFSRPGRRIESQTSSGGAKSYGSERKKPETIKVTMNAKTPASRVMNSIACAAVDLVEVDRSSPQIDFPSGRYAWCLTLFRTIKRFITRPERSISRYR
jgi:hypothetical protein